MVDWDGRLKTLFGNRVYPPVKEFLGLQSWQFLASKTGMINELRFTRSGQAAGFACAAVFCLALSAALALAGWRWNDTRMPEPLLPSPWFGAVPLSLAALLIWQACRLARQPMLALTSVGLEIYPFFRPKDDWQLVVWAEVASIEIDPVRDHLVITLSSARNAVIFVSLEPLSGKSRLLLDRAVEGVTARMRESGKPPM